MKFSSSKLFHIKLPNLCIAKITKTASLVYLHTWAILIRGRVWIHLREMLWLIYVGVSNWNRLANCVEVVNIRAAKQRSFTKTEKWQNMHCWAQPIQRFTYHPIFVWKTWGTVLTRNHSHWQFKKKTTINSHIHMFIHTHAHTRKHARMHAHTHTHTHTTHTQCLITHCSTRVATAQDDKLTCSNKSSYSLQIVH